MTMNQCEKLIEQCLVMITNTYSKYSIEKDPIKKIEYMGKINGLTITKDYLPLLITGKELKHG